MNNFFLDWHLDAENNPYELYIMRGVPGSGKSFEAKKLAPPEQVFSADDFFGNTIEQYKATWKQDKLGAAHSQCQDKTRSAMQRRLTPIVVDNTNTLRCDVLPYLELALRYGYRPEIKEPTSEWWLTLVVPYLGSFGAYQTELDAACKILLEKCQHGVPESTIRKMLVRWQTVSAADMMKSILRRK